jgi:tRNA/rRNA methyltransferase
VEASVVLVRPRHPGNIGSACRVIRNLGLNGLLIVGEHAALDDTDARKLAYHSLMVLEAAQTFDTLAEVASRFDVCVGTSARRGKGRRTPMTPRRFMGHLLEHYTPCRLAMVFGPEEAGLTSEELELCQFTVEIPTSPEHPSMNLSHAVAVLGYELMMALREPPAALSSGASVERRQELLARLESFLQLVGYPTRTSLERAMADARRVLLAAPMTDRDVKTVLGLLRHIRWRAAKGIQRTDGPEEDETT